MNDRRTDLVYDSARTETTFGIRSSLGADRTLIYRSGVFTVDLLVHTSKHPPTFLHGQIIQQETYAPVAGAQIRLSNAGSTAESDERGEFSLSTDDAHSEALLCVQLPGAEMRCRIPPLA